MTWTCSNVVKEDHPCSCCRFAFQTDGTESRSASSLSLARVRPSAITNGMSKHSTSSSSSGAQSSSSSHKPQRSASTYHRQRRHSDFCKPNSQHFWFFKAGVSNSFSFWWLKDHECFQKPICKLSAFEEYWISCYIDQSTDFLIVFVIYFHNQKQCVIVVII